LEASAYKVAAFSQDSAEYFYFFQKRPTVRADQSGSANGFKRPFSFFS